MAAMFLVQTTRRCHPVEAGTQHKALPFTVLIENHFCTRISTQQDPFPSPSPLPSAHSLKTHTHSHICIWGHPLERAGASKRAGTEEKSTLRKEKQKVHVLPFGTSIEGGSLACMALSVCTSLIPNIQDTYSTQWWDLISFLSPPPAKKIIVVFAWDQW